MPDDYYQPRWGHCAGAFSVRPGLTKVVVFGGKDKHDYLAKTTIFLFGRLMYVLWLSISWILLHQITQSVTRQGGDFVSP